MHPPPLYFISLLAWHFFAGNGFSAPLRIALASYPTHLHYAVSSEPQALAINALVALPLLDFNLQTGQLEPRLAKKFQKEPNRGALKSWLIELHSNAEFQTGKNVTADDVIRSWEQVFSADSKAAFLQQRLRHWNRPERITSTKIRFSATAPPADILETLASFFILSTDSQKQSQSRVEFNGAGPYTIEQIQDGARIRLLRKKDYWAEKQPWAKSFPISEKIDFIVEPDQRLAWIKLKNGNLDYLYVLSSSLWKNEILPEAPKQTQLNVQQFQTLQPGGVALFLWNLEHPILSERTVRCSLQRLMDRKHWSEVLFSQSYPPAEGFFPKYSKAHSSQSKVLAFDPITAQSELEKAGWKRGPDGVRQKDARRLSFEIQIDNPNQERIIAAFQEELRTAGVEAKIRITDWASGKRNLESRNYEAALVYRETPDLDNLARELSSDTHSHTQKKTLNRSGLVDTQIQRWLEEAQLAKTSKARYGFLQQIESRLTQECYFGFGWENSALRLAYASNLPAANQPIPRYAHWHNAFWSLAGAAK